jgi:hypothetical protein
LWGVGDKAGAIGSVMEAWGEAMRGAAVRWARSLSSAAASADSGSAALTSLALQLGQRPEAGPRTNYRLRNSQGDPFSRLDGITARI